MLCFSSQGVYARSTGPCQSQPVYSPRLTKIVCSNISRRPSSICLLYQVICVLAGCVGKPFPNVTSLRIPANKRAYRCCKQLNRSTNGGLSNDFPRDATAPRRLG